MAAIKISDSIQQGIDAFFAFVPNLIAFLVILVIGYFLAKIVSAIVRKALQKLGLDKALHESDAKQYVDRISPDASPSAAVGKVLFYILFVFVLTAAIGALKIPAVTAFMNQVLAYLPNVIAAIVIFVVAAAIAGAVAAGVAKLLGDTPTGKIVATAVPALLATVALASALAFGLGGREVAGEMLGDAYRKGQREKGQVKDDLEAGKQRGQDQAERGKRRAQQGAGDGSSSASAPAGGSYRAER